ncbi:2'-5' RNA ligase family protein [Chenggangzhangella methanolivorans]|uniref:2'-5' RNA ligase family protein n=1 Tax=Chenggangzhangella methanolivorans TaxID=1437009 RepID=A0A9E6R578_9HYPH|nr:2'-5' RNA ligase family protein [Chenggangzhangella methanolivorans]QZN98420.1 2'-5' RNA ligase family protein [Chenggangzhangella methanolivorans]
MTDPAPLILTLRLDADRQARFDALRAMYFPPERNFLAAHVTLFHKLPGDALSAIVFRLSRLAEGTPPPEVKVEAPYLIGRGVAFRLASPAADALRRDLAQDWRDWLTPQDRGKSRLHVTVQNKVLAAEAKALLSNLSPDFSPSAFKSPGLDLWRYLGGPWEHEAGFEFTAVSAPLPLAGEGKGEGR